MDTIRTVYDLCLALGVAYSGWRATVIVYDNSDGWLALFVAVLFAESALKYACDAFGWNEK